VETEEEEEEEEEGLKLCLCCALGRGVILWQPFIAGISSVMSLSDNLRDVAFDVASDRMDSSLIVSLTFCTSICNQCSCSYATYSVLK
jgi:hypothetical protein